MSLPLPRPGSPKASPLTASPPDDPLASPLVRALALEIAYRLRPVCGHLPEGELVKLVTRLALAQQGASTTGPTPRP